MGTRTAVVIVALTGAIAVGGELEQLPLGTNGYELVSLHEDEALDTRTEEVLPAAELGARLAAARVVVLGEEHTVLSHHLLQARVVKALAALPEELVVGMEFFQPSDDDALARWVAGEISEDELLEETGWYDRGGINFGYYRPILEAARDGGARIVGLNVPRSLTGTVAMGGLDALDDEQRALVGEVTLEGSPAHRYLFERYMGSAGMAMPDAMVASMYAAQSVWDVVMARSILAALPPRGRVVAIAGAGHVAYGLGIPRRLHEQLASQGRDDLTVATVVPVEVDEPEEDAVFHPMAGGGEPEVVAEAVFSRGLADYVVALEAEDAEAFPSLGFVPGSGAEGVDVRMVWPHSLAERATLGTGDTVVAVDGTPVSSPAAYRRLMADVAWGDRIVLGVRRDDETMEVPVLVYPPYSSEPAEDELVAPFTPGRSGPVLTPPGPEVPPLLWVRVDEGPRSPRVEVRLGDALLAVHELDADGRVARSVYLEPLADGTVEVVYERNEAGEVVAERRLPGAG